MSYRAAASLVMGLVALIAAIATTADVTAGPERRPAPASSTSVPGTSTRSGPAPQLCNVISQIERLTVTRADAYPQNGLTFSFPASVTVRSAPAASDVARALCALPHVPQGAVFHCPVDFGIVYHLVFTRKTGGSVQPVTVDATSCQFVHGAGPGTQTVSTTGSFWKTLGRAMGLAHPTNTTFSGSHGQA